MSAGITYVYKPLKKQISLDVGDIQHELRIMPPTSLAAESPSHLAGEWWLLHSVLSPVVKTRILTIDMVEKWLVFIVCSKVVLFMPISRAEK